MIEQYKKLVSEATDLSNQLSDIELQAFNEGSKELFAKYPKLESFSWLQYAPSFNDR